MVNENALTVSLEEFGLSQYEARAYVTLISKGRISASELAYYSELPRTKVYPVLLKLKSKKLAMISKSKPIMCTAIAPEDAFDEIVHEQINKVNAMNSLVTELKKASVESKKSRGAEEKRYFHLNANNVLDQLRTMIEGSKSSIHIMTDQWGLGLLAECKEQLLSVLRRNLEIKIVIPSTQICSETFKSMPNGVKIRVSDIIQNCFIFDESELMLIDSDNGKGATFSSTDILSSNQVKIFTQVWKNAIMTDCLADMPKHEAQEIYRIVKTINDSGLGHVLNSTLVSGKEEIDFVRLLEQNGVHLLAKHFDEVIEMIDSSLQITCAGHARFDENSQSITVESKLNSGHSLPWAAILEEYLKIRGNKTRMVYQSHSKGEKVHIKIS